MRGLTADAGFRRVFYRFCAVLSAVSVASVCAPVSGAVSESERSGTVWPDRQWLVDSLVKAIPGILESQDPRSGRFGPSPWNCLEQNVLLPLAVAYTTEAEGNPYYHDAKVLAAIAAGGDALVDAQDEQGRWVFRKKDNTTWGSIHMPWTYSRWIRAYALVKDSLPRASRNKWEAGLRKGFIHIRKYMNGHVHNIPTHHAMALYIAGQCFDVADWREAAAQFMARVVDAQNPDGFWSENYGPVVGYNHVYVDALGIYYAVSRDRKVLPALERSARFHANFLWPDGSPIAAIDERQVYHAERNIGNVGFSHTALGRGYLLRQTAPLRQEGEPLNADYAAAMLAYGGTGPAKPPPVSGDRGRFVLGDNKALVQRAKPWQFCLSAYCCPVQRNRWIQDRHNFLDVFHDDLGLVLGGGNTKLQPYWSTFVAGDPSALHHREGDEHPEFRPRVALRWVPTRTRLIPDPDNPSLELYYHTDVGRVTVTPQPDGILAITYAADLVSGTHFEAHVPFMKRTGRIEFASGRSLYLQSTPVELTSDETGDRFTWRGLRVSIPDGATLKWPCRQHNPYSRDGHAPLNTAKLVMILPFTSERTAYTVQIARAEKQPFDGLVFQAPDLHVTSPTSTRMKPLHDLGSFFLGATRPGESMTFTLPVKKGGNYELFADFVVFPGYGVVELTVDGKPVGEPFDAYAPELDSSGPISFGTLDLSAGPHSVNVKIVGKNAAAESHFVSVKSFMLAPALQE
jgi:hypothetical protein